MEKINEPMIRHAWQVAEEIEANAVLDLEREFELSMDITDQMAQPAVFESLVHTVGSSKTGSRNYITINFIKSNIINIDITSTGHIF